MKGIYSQILKKLIVFSIFLIVLAFHGSVCGNEVTEPDLWGVAIGIRGAAIPFTTEIDKVYDVIPLLYYEKGRVFIHGLEAGFSFYKSDRWRFSALGRYRFFDIPAEYQNEIQGDSFDLGGQLRYFFSDYFNTDLEVLSDDDGRVHANAVFNFKYSTENLELWPSLKLRWKSSEFNNTYYGLGVRRPGSAFDLFAGVDARYHVYRNLYLIGRAGLTILDDKTYDLDVIDSRTQSEIYFGFGFFEDRKEDKKEKKLSSKRYLRLAHGWATPSNIGDILAGNTEKDPDNNQMTSLFYGIPVSDHLFGLPTPIYFTPGLVLHHKSEVQDRILEYVLAMKLYYTFKWPITWRLGAAEGLSYVGKIPHVEQTEMDRKGYRASKLLNYLDFSLDIELGDLFKSKNLKGLWLGYSIHHRSGIFQTSSAFGRIKGGSNINSVYLQYHW